MFVFQLVFERRMERTNAVNIVVIRTNNIPFVLDHHCSPFKMKNTRGRQERKGGRKEGEIGFRLPDEWRQCQESAAPPLEQISLKNSALLVSRRKKIRRGRGRRRRLRSAQPAAVRERERAVTRNFGQLDRHRPLFQCWRGRGREGGGCGEIRKSGVFYNTVNGMTTVHLQQKFKASCKGHLLLEKNVLVYHV